ncbi:MAG: sigma-70 family RNA polymerase sigma factor [Treponema sp.]|nr:sigma-70 family RNA polymerase sigma factor [Treponema sp.]
MDIAGGLEHFIAQKRDALLIKQTLSGDSKAFAKLIRYYKKRIHALGLGFFKNETDTDDFMQEVFVKVYTNLAQFKGESAFSTWITRIAYNTAFTIIQRRPQCTSLPEETELYDPDLTPEEQQIRRITVEAVREAVRELPEKYSICLELYFFYDMSYEEIAVVTGFPLNTLKSHIFRAKKILRDKLRGFYHD